MTNVKRTNRFKTYEQQIQILSQKKDLVFKDVLSAEDALVNIGYFSLIGGYKDPFKDPMTRKYINTSFEDIFALYQFDRELRELSFKYLCEIEQKIRQVVSYCFCSIYGDGQSSYLSASCYRQDQKLSKDVTKLIQILDYIANKSTEHNYLVFQRRKYGNVPLWVAVNAITFGQISKMYSLLPFSIQSQVAQAYPYVNEKELEQYFKCLTLYRNVCAHNERLYCFRSRLDIPDTVLHNKLHIAKNGSQFSQGKHDYFGLVIALRYLLPNNSFIAFKHSLIKLISTYRKQSSRLSEQELYSILGLPLNWKSITKYKR